MVPVSKQPIRSKKWLALLAPLLLLVLLAVLELTNTTYLFHKKKIDYGSGTIDSKSSTPKDNVSIESDKNSGGGGTTSSDKGSQAPTDTSGVTLTAPTGTFISNHRPSLSGSSKPSAVESQCTTSPGASCYIEFTKDSVVKKLESQTVGSSQSVYWNWDIKNAGLTTGTWKVKAITTLGDKTETASDPIDLEVQP